MFSLEKPSNSDWERIHDLNLDFGQCWKHCGSYCCNSNSEHIKLSLMKPNSAGMVFMPSEYEFLASTGRLQTGFAESMKKHSVTLESGVQIDFITAICDLKGLCSQCEYRPLICKLYPYYPYFNILEDKITGFITGSALDQHWDDLKLEHPCWLVRNESEKVQKAVRDCESSLNHPYVMFYMNVAAHFLKQVTQALKTKKTSLFSLDPKSFFAQWEVLYLTGSLLDKPNLKLEYQNLYEQALQRQNQKVSSREENTI